MCRAIWVVVIGASDEACKQLRRAAGPDTQIVALTTSLDEALSVAASGQVDVVVLDGTAPDASAAIQALRKQLMTAAIVWIGDNAPDGVDRALPWEATSIDTLPGAITAALIARRRERTG
jgi:DNA-binding NarL/FixJ family response regulator